MLSSVRRAVFAGGFALLASACGLDTVGTADIGSAGGSIAYQGEGAGGATGGAAQGGGQAGQAGHSGGAGHAGHAAGGGGSSGSGGQVSFPCGASRGDCDGNPGNGCETDTDTNAMDCGQCGHACPALANMVATCTMGVCGSTCASGFADCDGNTKNGCETNLADDPASCGACGKSCGGSVAHGTPTCANKTCGVTCDPGFGDCDGNTKNGCEIDVSGSVLHCGSCANSCPSGKNGTATCVASTCQTTCATGFGDCDGDPHNGCETDTTSSDTSCGQCGNSCSVGPHAGGSCVSSMCTASCDPGFADCDSDKTNGCESDLGSSILACGGCQHACGTSHATPTCAAGACVEACDSGFGDCDGDDQNGCETDVTVSATSCGKCGNACSSINGTAMCAASACSIACTPGFDDCDGDSSNGCEAVLATSDKSCGACGHVCGAAHGAPACGGGVCSFACASGYSHCTSNDADGCETSTATSVTDCGACGHDCGSANGNPSCAAGKCAFQCAAGHAHCSGVDSTGCETLIAGGDPQNCGACGHACGTSNAIPTCVASACSFACAPGFGHCSGQDSTGCESSLDAPTSCGACGHVCGNANGSPSCSAGACSFGCASGYAHCGANDATGCETAVAGDAKNCGACGHDCLGGTCVAGVCQSVSVSATESFPLDIFSDASGLYWIDWGTLSTDHFVNGSIREIPAGMAAPITLAANQPWPTHFALDATNVYWTNRGSPAMAYADGQIAKAKKGTAGATVLLANQNLPYGIAVDSTTVYWTSNTGAAIGAADLAGTNPKTLVAATDPQPLGLALLGSTLYWTTAGGIVDSAKSDGTNEAVFTPGVPTPDFVIADASGVYFAAGGNGPAFTDGVIYRANLDGTGLVQLATNEKRPLGLAVDGSYIYWAAQGSAPGYLDGAIKRTLKNGAGGAETIASGLNHPGAVAVDATNVYYTLPVLGSVMKVAK